MGAEMKNDTVRELLPEAPPGAAVEAGGGGRVRVKVCGITCVEDAWAAVRAGVDALGFNSWKGSRRWLEVREASRWMRDLPPFVSRVVLCINAPLEEALELSALPGVDAIQFHGEESADYLAAFAEKSARPFIRAVRLEGEASIQMLEGWEASSVLVDAAVPGAFGGTGALADLELARTVVERFPRMQVILAGGLNPQNVGDAVRRVRPYAVDVASGVEGSTPGRKDLAKMAAFVESVRNGSVGPFVR
jgi:phosphoribosylanthranilate isomerase